MAYRLPPLNTLRLFEAAGRLLSFKAAAAELHLTPSAVSHGVQSLEDWLGVPLFIRGPRGLALTEAGTVYLPQIRDTLDHLVKATDAVPGRRPGGRLAVSVAPSFGLRWLIPRLPRFSERYPAIEVSVDTTHRHVDFPRDGVDLAIRMGQGDWPELEAICLAREELVPVCAPSLAPGIRQPTDLDSATLLHVVTVAEDWRYWLVQAQLPTDRIAGSQVTGNYVTGGQVTGGQVTGGLRFDTIHMALEAAAEGLGIAIGRLPLIATDIAAGRLVPVLGPPRPCTTSYWLVTTRDALARPEVTAFRDWIRAELDTPATKDAPAG